MVLQGDVRGREEIAHIKALLGILPEKLRKDLAEGTRSALAPLKKEIPAAAVARMPSGYGPLLARSTKVSYRVTAGVAVKATVTVSAKGKVENRDVRARNRGEMRHPLFGNKAHWYVQRVRPGFVDDPVGDARKRIVRNAEDARDKSADMLLRE